MGKKITAPAIALTLAFCASLTVGAATTFADTNREIEIVPGGHVGYQFVGSRSNPDITVDITKIAKVKYYIKCPELEWLGPAEVQLVFNSGTTGWSQAETHDLHDGLIIERDVPQLAKGDYFEALLGTWNEEIAGTVSFEVLDTEGNVLGADIYGELYPANTAGKDGNPETPETPENPETDETEPTEPPKPEESESESSEPSSASELKSEVLGTGTENNVNTGGQEIAAICAATVLSIGVIIAARRKKDE